MLTFSVIPCASREGARKGARHLLGPTLTHDLAMELAQHSGPALAGGRSIMRLTEDADPNLATILGIPKGPLDEAALTHLMMGLAADGERIPGLRQGAAQPSLASRAHMTPNTWPTASELSELAGGQLADGSAAGDLSQAQRNRIFSAFGVAAGCVPDEAAIRAIATGTAADGTPLSRKRVLRTLNHEVGPVAAVALCWSAAKSVSVAWALTSGAERALIEDAHHEGVAIAMDAVQTLLGHVRRGEGGRWRHAAALAPILGTHYTSRPVHSSGVAQPGDVQLHDHVLLPAVARAEDGRLGKIDAGCLRGEVKRLGATYQAATAAALRRRGIATSLDPDQAACRIDAIPEEACTSLSKRTRTGFDLAQSFAGPGFGSLRHRQRAGLLKAAIQGDPRASRCDDIARPASWRDEIAHIVGSDIQVVQVGPAPAVSTRRDRIALATTIAAERLAAASTRGERMLPATAAAIGLIQAGLEDRAEIDEVTRALGGGDAPDPFDDIDGKRHDGSAIRIGGGDVDIASVWIERQGHNADPSPLQVASAADARHYNDVVRTECQAQGLVGQDVVRITIASDGKPATIGIARGDRVVTLAPVNGRHHDGRRGRVLSAGGTALVVDVNQDGLTIETHSSTRATVRWQTLFDPASQSMMIEHAYARPWPCRAGPGGIAIITEGSASVRRLDVPNDTMLLFLDPVERAHMASRPDRDDPPDDEAVWASTKSNLAMRHRPQHLEAARSARWAAVTLSLKAAMLIGRSGQGGRWSRLRRRSTLLPKFEGIANALERLERAASHLVALVANGGQATDALAAARPSAWRRPSKDIETGTVHGAIGVVPVRGPDVTSPGRQGLVARSQPQLANVPAPGVVAPDPELDADVGSGFASRWFGIPGVAVRVQSLVRKLRGRGRNEIVAAIAGRIAEAVDRNAAMVRHLASHDEKVRKPLQADVDAHPAPGTIWSSADASAGPATPDRKPRSKPSNRRRVSRKRDDRER